MRSPGNAVAFWAMKNCTVAAQTRTRMERFIFSLPSLYRLDRHRAARIRVHLQKISILRLLTLALSSNPPSPGSGAAGVEERFLNASPARISLGACYKVDRPLRGRC